MAAPRTRAQAALRMRQLTIDNHARKIATLKARLAKGKLERQELNEIRHLLESDVQRLTHHLDVAESQMLQIPTNSIRFARLVSINKDLLERIEIEKDRAAQARQRQEEYIAKQDRYVSKLHDTMDRLQDQNNYLHSVIENMEEAEVAPMEEHYMDPQNIINELQSQLQKKEMEIKILKERNEKLERDNYQLDGNNICIGEDLREARVEEKKLRDDVRRYAAYHLESERQHEITKQELKKAQDRILTLQIRSDGLVIAEPSVKIEHQRPAGTLLSLPIPQWKWEHITMDFVTGLPRVRRGFNSIWVIVDRLTKSAHFLPVKTTYSMNQYAEDYIAEIVRLHGVPVSIVSDRDPRFTSEFWKSLHRAMGSRLAFSTAYHPQSDGQSERVIQILEDMLRACTIDFPGSWDSLLPLAEFTYNNSYQATIGMAPYEALYGRKCRSPLYWDEVGERKMLGPELVQQTADVVAVIRERMKTAQSRQKSYADVRRRPLQFEIGDHVFLKIAPLKGVMRFGKKGKLSPRFIGPFEILDRVGDRAYRLALPPDLDRVHNVFHVSMLRKYVADPSHVLRHEPLDLTPNLTYQEIPIQILDRTVRVLRNKEIGIVKVLWRNHLLEEATWEPEDEMRENIQHRLEEKIGEQEIDEKVSQSTIQELQDQVNNLDHHNTQLQNYIEHLQNEMVNMEELIEQLEENPMEEEEINEAVGDGEVLDE
ncbi:uncharacterized protein [Primulina eburnea]|uniref:uncharacterized protein n=1 Tax=Primulina eburnea TaxID=1245227 RepID=UPI003C6BEC46